MRAVLALLFFLAPAAIIGGLLWRHTWCSPPDSAIKVCRGTIAGLAIRRCVPKRIPPPAELQKPIPNIARAFKKCTRRMEIEGAEALLPYVESTLAVVEAEHGRNSPAYASALTRVIMLLAGLPEAARTINPDDPYEQIGVRIDFALMPDKGRFNLIRPYSEAAISVSREVYGPEHRETAMARHIHADVLIHSNKDGYAPEAVPLLRDSAEIRRLVLGKGHVETLSAEGRLAQILFAEWRQADERQPGSPLLEEAETLAERVVKALPTWNVFVGFSKLSTDDMNILLGRIAHARGDYEKAVAHFEKAFTFSGQESPILYPGKCRQAEAACREYADALRRLGREEEAWLVEEQVRSEVPPVADPAVRACKGKIAVETIREGVSNSIPPPMELQPPIRTIEGVFANCGDRIGKEGAEAVLPYLDSTLAVIEAEYGQKSPAYAQALTQIIILLSRSGNPFDLMRPYSEAAVSMSREVYGTDHRETAIMLHTHAVLLIGLGKTDEAIRILREAAEIRRRVIGAHHEETVAAEGELARLLYQKSQQTDDRTLQKSLLGEAKERAQRALVEYPKKRGNMGFSKQDMQILLGRIANLRGNYEEAVAHFDAAFGTSAYGGFQHFTCPVDLLNACADYALALRKLGRDEDAAAVEQAIEEAKTAAGEALTRSHRDFVSLSSTSSSHGRVSVPLIPADCAPHRCAQRGEPGSRIFRPLRAGR